MDENKKMQKQKTLVDGIWDFLASVKLAVMIFTAISLTSIVGTLIEQGASRAANIEVIAKFVGDSMAPQVYSLLYTMGFMNMYQSWWFIGLLMLFAINLIICSIDRIPPAWRAATEKLKPLSDEQFGGFPVKRQVLIDGAPADNEDRIRSAFRQAGFSAVQKAEVGDGYQLISSKQGYSRLGVYVTHLSILVIMIGAVIGVMFGFKGSVYIMEGEASAVAYKSYPLDGEQEGVAENLLKNGGDLAATAAMYDYPLDGFIKRLSQIGVEPLGFIVRCDDSGVDFYPESFSPKEYTSDLSVFEGGGGVPVVKKRIEVNDPLKYKGFTFYQSSHGVQARSVGRSAEGIFYYAPYEPTDLPVFKLTVNNADGKSHKVDARFGQPFELPGTAMTATILRFIPSYGGGERQQGSMSNLVVDMEVTGQGGSVYNYAAAKRFDRPPLPNGTSMRVDDVWGIEYTGLQVRRDPGVWIVYLGCAIMSIGLFMAFFMSHRRIWVQATASGGRTSIKVAGTAHKHRDGFEHKVDRALGLLSEGGK